MKNESKTERQLVQELIELRQQIVKLEKAEAKRKQTEEALRESEKRYKEVVESASEIIHTTDIYGKFTFANTAALKAAGTSLEEIKQLNYPEIIHPDHRQRLSEIYINQFRERKATIYVEFPILSRSGEVIWLGQNSSLMFEGEKVVGFHSVARDITELKKVEETLQRSEKEAKQLAQENAVMAEIGRIISSTLNIEEIYERFIEEVCKLIQGDRITIAIANPGGSTLTLAYAWGLGVEGRKTGGVYPLAGTASGKAMQTRLSILTQGENIEEALKLFPAFSSYYKSGFQSMIVVPLISKNNVIGTLLFLSMKPKAYTQLDVLLAERVGNQIAGAIANAQLFIEQKRAETVNQEQLSFLQVLIDTIPNPIFYKDQDGKYLGCNEAWGRMHGFKREEVVGKTVYDIAPKDLADIYRLRDKELMARGGIQVYETVIMGADGQRHNVIFNKATFYKTDSTIGGLVGVTTDITERKRIEEALRRSEEEAKRLAQENAVMAEIGRIISSTLDIEGVYERFTEEVQKLFLVDRTAFTIINPEDRTASTVYASGIKIPSRHPGDVFPLAGSGTEKAEQAKSGLIIKTEDENEVAEQVPGLLPVFRAGIRSVIMIPLISRDQVIGVLNLQSLKPNAYTEKELRIAERVGTQIAGAIANAQLFAERNRVEEEREKLIRDLQKALSEVKTLKGIFPICASCKKIRDDKGYWNQVEVYIRDRSEAEFSHGICPDCMKKLYPDFYKEDK